MSLSVLGGRGVGPQVGFFFFFFFFFDWVPCSMVFFQNSSVNVYPPIIFLLLTWEIIQHNPVQVPPSSK